MTTDNDEYETIEDKERGCGHLDKGKAYVQSPPKSELGTLPAFVELNPPVPFYESHFRGYERFPGVHFETAATPSSEEWASLEGLSSRIEAFEPTALRDFPDVVNQLEQFSVGDVSEEALAITEPAAEIQRHLNRLDISVPDATDVGSMMSANAHDLIMWVGETYYEDPQDFIDEVHEMGLNKAIPTSQNHEPPAIDPGITRLFLIHPNAVHAGHDDDGEPQYAPGIIGYSYLWRTVITENENGEWAAWQKDLADADKVDLVRIGEKIAADGGGDEEPVNGGTTLKDYEDDEVDDEHLVEMEAEEDDDEPLTGLYDAVVGHADTIDGVATLLLYNGEPVAEMMIGLDVIPPRARNGEMMLSVTVEDGKIGDVMKMPTAKEEYLNEVREAFRGDQQ